MPALGIVVAGGVQVIRTASLAALVYAGASPALRVDGLALAMIASCIAGVWIALRFSIPGTQSAATSVPAAIVAVAVAAATAMAAPGTGDATALATVTAAGVVVGGVMLLFGLTGGGRLVRYLPHAVIGGVLASTGWVLVKGAMSMMARPVDAALLSPAAVLRWLPGIAIGLVLLVLKRTLRRPLVMPIVLVASGLVFHLVAWWNGVSFARLAAMGWLLGPFPEGQLWRLPAASAWFDADLVAVAAQLPTLLAAAFAAALLTILYGGAVELLSARDSKPGNDLQDTGVANLLAAVFSGLPTTISPSATSLTLSLRVRRRLDAVLITLMTLAVLAIGPTVLSVIPLPVLGGVLVSLGAEYLYDWLVIGHRRLAWIDLLVVASIVAAVATAGLLVGIGVGMALAVALFVVAVARTDVVVRARSGGLIHSRVTRSAAARAYLEAEGDRIVIYRLGGIVFFGTADHLVAQVKERLPEPPTPKFVLLDVRTATTFDATGGQAVVRIVRSAGAVGAEVIVVGAGRNVRATLARAGAHVGLADDLDHALETCEDRLLIGAGLDAEQPRFEDVLRELSGGGATWQAIRPWFERVELGAEEVLVQQGEPGDSFWLLEEGRITAERESVDGTRLRLETLGPGRLVGELAFVTRAPRSARLVADAPSVLYRMDRQGWDGIVAHEPAGAMALRDLMLRLTAERVQHLSSALVTAGE